MGADFSEYQSEEVNDIVLGLDNSIYTTDSFYGSIDFDPGIGAYYLNYLRVYDIFLHKMSQDIKIGDKGVGK